jgi:hypothetical protein
VDLNLDTLKREILAYVEAAGLALFHSNPGGLEGLPMVLWDSEKFPDYRSFLGVAQKCGVHLVIFASREFDAEDIEELSSQLDDCELTREERRDYETRLRELRIYEGVTCSLELAFSYDSRIWVYDLQPDWYADYCAIEDELIERMSGDDEHEGDDDSLGGYFSNN